MKIATWNVNSIQKRLPLILSFLEKENIDILCLQETKISDKDFPAFELKLNGYYSVFSGAGKNNGVAIISKYPVTEQKVTASDILYSEPRFLLATIQYGGVERTIATVYVPVGGFKDMNFLTKEDREKWNFKLNFLRSLYSFIKKEPIDIISGDFNMVSCLAEISDKSKSNFLCCSERERNIFSEFLKLGYNNAHKGSVESPVYSWWSYQFGHYQSNIGYKLDHILYQKDSIQCKNAIIANKPWREVKDASDHAPLYAEFEFF